MPLNDTPHVLSAAFVYELPVGQGKKYLDQGGITNALLGGWQVSTIFRYSSGLPMFFRVQGTSCNVPGAFRAGCIPAIINPDAVFAQDKGSFDPGKGPLFNKDAFEPLSAFNFYYGQRQPDRRERPRIRLSQPGSLVHQEHEDGGPHEPPVPLRDLQPVELAHVQSGRFCQ